MENAEKLRVLYYIKKQADKGEFENDADWLFIGEVLKNTGYKVEQWHSIYNKISLDICKKKWEMFNDDDNATEKLLEDAQKGGWKQLWEETRIKQSMKKRAGRAVSEETRKKMSEAGRKRAGLKYKKVE